MDKAELNNLKRGKTAQEKRAIDYFNAEGCGSRPISDEAYDELLKAKINELDIKGKALLKIGVDEKDLNEIPPVFFSGYENEINGKKAYVKLGKDGLFRTSAYSATYLFFGGAQVFMYNLIFDMTSGSKKENTEEYFYKDITNFSTSCETVEFYEKSGCGNKQTKKQTEITKFALIVPGSKFYCSTSSVNNVDESLNAMKLKLREKKA